MKIARLIPNVFIKLQAVKQSGLVLGLRGRPMFTCLQASRQ